MISLDIQVSKYDRLVAELYATNKQIERASTNAKNATGTYGRKQFIGRASSRTGLKRRPLGKAVHVRRISRGSRRDFAVVRTRSTRIPIRFWRWRYVPIDATRARVEVQDGLNGGWSTAYAFVNPSSRGRVPLARYPDSASSRETLDSKTVVELRTRQLLLIGGRGVSLKNPFRQWATNAGTLNDVSKELARQFRIKLDAQLRRGRR